MASKTIPLTAVVVRSGKPTAAYGQEPYFTLTSAARFLLRGNLADIPAGAVVSSVRLRIWERTAASSQTLSAQALTTSFNTSVTYGTAPTFTTVNAASVTRAAASNSLWDFDITPIAVQWVPGALTNNGVQVVVTSAGSVELRGSAGSILRPEMLVTYTLAPEMASNLHPSSGAAVSKTKPVLSFQVPNDTTGVQVQIDPAANATSPTFDSGTIVTSAGMVDLSTTTYGGLTSGSTQWRARARNAQGYPADAVGGGWTAWVSFSYAGKGTFTFSTPGTTSEDPSPPIGGTLSGATLKGWQAVTLDASGAVVEDSGLRNGGPVAFGPTKAYVTAQVDTYDDVIRESTPGDTQYLRTTRTFTTNASGSIAAYTGAVVSSNGVSPVQTITASRSAIPDEVAVYRRPGISGMELHEVFTRRPDGAADSTADTGQALTNYSLNAPSAPWFRSGFLTTKTPASASAGTYRIAQLGGDVTQVGARFAFTSWTNGGGLLALSIQQKSIATNTPVPVSPLHLTVSPEAWGMAVNAEDGTGVETLRAEVYNNGNLIADGATLYTVEAVLNRAASTVTMYLPSGQVITMTDPRFSLPGTYVYVEPFKDAQDSGKTNALVSEWWADCGTGSTAASPGVNSKSLGDLVVRGPGTTYMSGSSVVVPDYSAPMNADYVYDVYAITNGAWSKAGSTASIHPRCVGVWLADPDDGSLVALLDTPDGGQTRDEGSVEHQPIDGSAIIRRRLYRGKRKGVLDGHLLLDAVGALGRLSEANLLRWADQDAGHVYRLVLGNKNHRVILGNLDVLETAQNRDGQYVTGVVGSWWLAP